MRRWFIACGCLIAFSMTAWAALDKDAAAKLATSLDAVGRQADTVQADAIVAVLDDATITDADWDAFWREYADKAVFSAPLQQFWEYALTKTSAPPRTTFISALCSAAMLAKTANGKAPASGGVNGLDSGMAAANWLIQAAPRLSPEAREGVFETFRKTIGGSPVDLTSWFQPGITLAATPSDAAGTTMATAATPLVRLPFAIQLCLAVQAYLPMDPRAVTAFNSVLRLPEPMNTFFQAYGIFLLGGMALDEQQFFSLNALMAQIPPELHNIDAIIVPEGLPGTDSTALMTLGQRVYIHPIPMDQFSLPTEFTPPTGQPVAPLFTLEAAVAVFRAIQDVQFTRRPGLAARRDDIVYRGQARPMCYLRQTVPSGLYMENPGELLPMTAWLWFTNSEASFHTAMELLVLREGTAMDAVLLLADVLSNGGGTTLLFAIDGQGRVTSTQTPIGRARLEAVREQPAPGILGATLVPVGADLVNAIGIGGGLQIFDFNSAGSAWRRRIE